MRHGKLKYKLGVAPAHRKSIIRNLSISLIDGGQIKTTMAKAKAVKPFIEKLITIAKEDTVSNRRLAFSRLNNKDAVKNLFDNVAPKFKERNGGYTRVVKLPELRVGDASKMSYISFVD